MMFAVLSKWRGCEMPSSRASLSGVATMLRAGAAFGRRCLVWSVITCVLVVTASPLTAAPPRVQLKSATVYPEIALSNTVMATRYDLVILQDNAVTPGGWDPVADTDVGDPQRIQKLKAVKPNIKVLLYVFPQISWGWEDGFREEWVVRGADGQPVLNPDDPNEQLLMNINNAEYRRFIIRRIVDTVNRYGFDGVYNDGIWPTVNLGQDYVGWTPRPPRGVIDNWHAWSLQLLRELKRALGSKLLITNSTPVYDDGDPKNLDDDFLAVVDGTVLEGYLHAPWDPPTTDNRDWWTWQQSMVKRNSDAGKYFIGISGTDDPVTPAQARRWQLFTFSSYLLRADGKRTYYQWQWWGYFPEIDAPIGTPLGDAYSSGGVWQRDFANGKVLVNVSATTRTIDLPRPMLSVDGGVRISRVTLGPSTAAILLN